MNPDKQPPQSPSGFKMPNYPLATILTYLAIFLALILIVLAALAILGPQTGNCFGGCGRITNGLSGT